MVDVTQPTAPRQAARVDLPDGAYAVHLAGGRAYVAAGASGLRVFGVSRPAAPRAIGHIDTPGDARHVTVQRGTVYVSDGAGGLLVLSQASVSPTAKRDATATKQAIEPAPTPTPMLTQRSRAEPTPATPLTTAPYIEFDSRQGRKNQRSRPAVRVWSNPKSYFLRLVGGFDLAEGLSVPVVTREATVLLQRMGSG